jgi:transcriptional regulator with PAS, ATPase and Fis domain
MNQDKHIALVIREARDWGADIVVGDTISVKTAAELGLFTRLVRSGPEAIASAVEAAANMLEHMNVELLRSKRLNLMMEHSDMGILYLTADDVVEHMNSKAEKIMGTNKDRLVGKTMAQGRAPDILFKALGSETRHQLIKIDEKDYMLEISRIFNDGVHVATLIFLESSTRIKNLEGMIRKQMIDRGLVANYTFENLIATEPILLNTIEKARRYSQTNATILLMGETGSGKEVFAQSIHNASNRKDGPFVAVNCAALPDTLLESELFGYAEGAFTGARKGGKPGLFEMAHKGTIFLDEVSEMSNNVQARFLRVLQEKQAMRIGDNRLYDVDVRVIAASNKELAQETEEGRFRRDLYYRIKVLDIRIPSLRERRRDILVLFDSFIDYFNTKYHHQQRSVPEPLREAIASCEWPGNVRQLRNFAEKVSVLLSLNQKDTDIVEDLMPELCHGHKEGVDLRTGQNSLKDAEAQMVRDCWLKNHRNISETARQLKIDRATVRKHVQRLNTKQSTG